MGFSGISEFSFSRNYSVSKFPNKAKRESAINVIYIGKHINPMRFRVFLDYWVKETWAMRATNLSTALGFKV